MPQAHQPAHKSKSKNPVQAETVAKGPRSRADKSKLKQAGFAEGSALLKPQGQSAARTNVDNVQARTKVPKAPKLPPLPQVPQVAQNRALAEDPQGQQREAAVQIPEAEQRQAEAQDVPVHPVQPVQPVQPERAQAQAQDDVPEPQVQLPKWCVEGQDDPTSVTYCAVTKQAGPDRAAVYLAEATAHLDKLKAKPDVYDKLKKTMSDQDMIMVALYSTEASYAMNAVLRGQLKSAPWMFAYSNLAAQAARAIVKVPKGARNGQVVSGHGDPVLMDASKKEDKILSIGTVYRADKWTGFFNPVFAADYQVGRSFEEPGFLSTTLLQDSYGAGAPVQKTIEDAKVSRSLGDLSTIGTENEALFPPGQRFQITAIEHEDTATGIRTPCSNPGKAFPKADEGKEAFNNSKHIWHVKMKHVKVAKGKKSTAPEKKDKRAAKPDKPPQPSTFLERLLGVANTMD